MNLRVGTTMLCLFLSALSYAGYPRRIVPLAPSITKNLYILGEEENIVAVTLYCPAPIRNKEIIGSLLEPNIEKIFSLSPDLVIATKEGNRKETVEELRRLGIKVFVLEADNNFDDICNNFLVLSSLVGKEEKAGEILASARKRIAAVQNKVKLYKTVKVFWEIGTNPLFTLGNNTFVNDYTTYAGGENIFSDVKGSRYFQINREEVIKRDPDVILLVTMGNVSEDERQLWRKFKALKAVKENRIYMIEGETILLPSPLAFVQGLETIAVLLHPEIKR